MNFNVKSRLISFSMFHPLFPIANCFSLVSDRMWLHGSRQHIVCSAFSRCSDENYASRQSALPSELANDYKCNKMKFFYSHFASIEICISEFQHFFVSGNVYDFWSECKLFPHSYSRVFCRQILCLGSFIFIKGTIQSNFYIVSSFNQNCLTSHFVT